MDYTGLKEMGIDPLEVKKMIGRKAILVFEADPRKIENAFWSNPCGYWTECYKLEDGVTPVMRSEIKEFI